MQISYGLIGAESDETVDRFIDKIQQDGECCGLDRPQDWQKTRWIQGAQNAEALPASCCLATLEKFETCRTTASLAFKIGCREKIL